MHIRNRRCRRIPHVDVATAADELLQFVVIIVFIIRTTTTVVDALKIAFVGDTGLGEDEDEESFGGYGKRTFDMIASQNVDLVVDVGDFDYWGRCAEEYVFVNTFVENSQPAILHEPQQQQQQQQQPPPERPEPEPYTLMSRDNKQYTFFPNEHTTIKRYRWQHGREGSLEGWYVGLITQSPQSSPSLSSPSQQQQVTDADTDTEQTEQRFFISHPQWIQLRTAAQIGMTLLEGERNCYDEPWDGPWEWNQFLREYPMAFLGASGNVEVRGAPLYGSPEIWADHKHYLFDLYQQRIFNRNRGVCRGYYNSSFPGTKEEYGERFSCFFGNDDNGNGNSRGRVRRDHHILLLGWYQGSTENLRDDSVLARQQTIDFIEREFSSVESKNVKWRYCIHHMTSAKLSAGEAGREHMGLSGITDACRRHGALIFNGHHHIYSRTKMLEGVGGPLGNESIVIAPNSSQNIIREGNTMSVTVGMGGYDGSCSGNYADASWMGKCVASWDQHRGAVIAEFNDVEPWIGTFRYMNSLFNASVVDEFILISQLPGWDETLPPTMSPTESQQQQPNTGTSASSSSPSYNTPSGQISMTPNTDTTMRPTMGVPRGIAGPKPEENINLSTTTTFTPTTSSSAGALSPSLATYAHQLCAMVLLILITFCG